MTCPVCQAWAAHSRSQHELRLERLSMSNTAPYACPSCGATDWATTDLYIVDPPMQRQQWYSSEVFAFAVIGAVAGFIIWWTLLR